MKKYKKTSAVNYKPMTQNFFEKINYSASNEEAKLYWTSNLQFLNKGVLYCGTLEKYISSNLATLFSA